MISPLEHYMACRSAGPAASSFKIDSAHFVRGAGHDFHLAPVEFLREVDLEVDSGPRMRPPNDTPFPSAHSPGAVWRPGPASGGLICLMNAPRQGSSRDPLERRLLIVWSPLPPPPNCFMMAKLWPTPPPATSRVVAL